MTQPVELISAAALSRRVEELGREIDARLPAGPLTVVGVLRGAFVFMADLVRVIPRPMTCDFLGVRSYGDATLSSGVVEITSDLATTITDRRVLLIEDIADTGLTLKYLLDLLAARGPASLHTCALLSKPSRRRIDINIDFVGFEVPDEFVVGYGLDAGQLVPQPAVHRRPQGLTLVISCCGRAPFGSSDERCCSAAEIPGWPDGKPADSDVPSASA